MEIPSLLQLSFSKVQDISYETVYQKKMYGEESDDSGDSDDDTLLDNYNGGDNGMFLF